MGYHFCQTRVLVFMELADLLVPLSTTILPSAGSITCYSGRKKELIRVLLSAFTGESSPSLLVAGACEEWFGYSTSGPLE